MKEHQSGAGERALAPPTAFAYLAGMFTDNVTNARAILAMLRPEIEEAQHLLEPELFSLDARHKLQQTLAAVYQATDSLDRLLSNVLPDAAVTD